MKTAIKNPYLFKIGDIVTYRSENIPYTVLKRKRIKHNFLSEANGRSIYINVYETKPLLVKSIVTYSADDENLLTSYDVTKPINATDYTSDESTADYLDVNGNILKTVKSGYMGRAHEIVSSHFLHNKKS